MRISKTRFWYTLGILLIVGPVLMGCGNERSSENEEKNDPKEVAIEPALEWDFSKKRKMVYSYYQTVKAQNQMDPEALADQSLINMIGKLAVGVTGVSLAELSITEANSSMLVFDSNGKMKDSLSQKVPDMVVKNMSTKGRFADQNTDLLFKIMFPLPDKMLKKGQSEKVQVQMPFNVNGSKLFVRGFQEFTFMGYEELEGRKCAVLEMDIDVSELDVPEILKGEFRSVAKGKGTYYFDLNDRIYVGADIKLNMNILIDRRADEALETGNYALMNSESEFRLRLLTIEE